MTTRAIVGTTAGMAASDGAGVRLTRMIGSPELDMLDPFLMLDSFRSDDPDDYIAGFPPHPHRGFETVTYLLAGKMRHEDNAGHAGVIETGGIQWMTAGRGIVHSEMPEQEDGLLWGFQLWVNLPAASKMIPPRYQEFPAADIPEERRADGSIVRVITGTTAEGTEGPVRDAATAPKYLDVALPAGTVFEEPVEDGHNGFIFVAEGAPAIEGTTLAAKTLGILGPGDRVRIEAGAAPARFLLVSGRPLGEPVHRAGPFVMASREDLVQAFDDFRSGRV